MTKGDHATRFQRDEKPDAVYGFGLQGPRMKVALLKGDP